MKIHVFKGADGWRWNLVSRNGRKIATSGEAFDSRRNALRAARMMNKMIPAAILQLDA